MELIDFVIKAKLSCYATNEGSNKVDFDDGSRGFKYLENGYKYIDRYYGFNPFVGFEQVFDSEGQLVWSMNYYGSVSQSCTDPAKIYGILKLAMQNISRDFPFRGPAILEKDGHRYTNSQTGAFHQFEGTEKIEMHEKELYSLSYHGGLMKQYT